MTFTPDGYRMAVIGATGAVGRTVLEVLATRDKLPIEEVVAFASPGSEGTTVRYGSEDLHCRVLSDGAIAGFDLVFSAAGGSVSQEWAPRFVQQGSVVIDKTSSWRMDSEVPLLVPEVNPEDINDLPKGIISSPNCSTMQLVVALNQIYRRYGLRQIVVSTYQSVSGTGGAAIRELEQQTTAVLSRREPQSAVYPHQIAFNALPQVESFNHEESRYAGYSTEEIKMMRETRKIFGLDPDDDTRLPISATCVRVPVVTCHSESVLIETESHLSASACRELLRDTQGVVVADDPESGVYPMAVDVAGSDNVSVGRIRAVPGRPNCLSLWIVADNLRKGAATNAVQVAELLHARAVLRDRKPEPQYA